MNKKVFTIKELREIAEENKVLFDLVLRGIINLKDIPSEFRLIDKSLYIAALRNSRHTNGSKAILEILKNDIELLEQCKYKEELYNSYNDWKMIYAIVS